MFWILLDFEVADENVTELLGFRSVGNVQGYSKRPSKRYKTTKKSIWCAKKLRETVWNREILHYKEIPKFFPKFAKGAYIERYIEGFKVLRTLRHGDVKTLLNIVSLMFKKMLFLKQLKNCRLSGVTQLAKRLDFIGRSTMQKYLTNRRFSNWSCNFFTENCFFSVYIIKSLL